MSDKSPQPRLMAAWCGGLFALLACVAPAGAQPAVPDSLAVPSLRVLWPESTVSAVPAADAPSALDSLLAGVGMVGPGAGLSRLVSVPLLILLYSLAALLALRLSAGVGRRWRAWLMRAVKEHVTPLSVRGFELFSVSQIARVLVAILGRADAVVSLVVVAAWVIAVSELFPWTHGLGATLLHVAFAQTLEMLRSLLRALPGLFTIVVIVTLFRGLMWLSDRFFDAVAAGTVEFGHIHPELAAPSKRLARIALWVVAITLSFPHVPGAESRTVQGVSILIGLMASLGSTGFVGNVIAGIVLTYSRSFQVGDRVRIGEYVGDVTSLGFFATKLRSLRHEELTLPNGQVANTAVLNYTRLAAERGLILYTSVTIGYDADWRTVHALLIEAAKRVEGVEKTPEPWVWQRSLNDSHITYELNCVTRQSHLQLRLYSELHQEIQDAFARAGLEILSPMYHAIRDANAAVLPGEPAGPRPEPWGFRVQGPGPGPGPGR